MNCTDMKTLWDDRLDGTLDAHHSAAFDAHLATCPSCLRLWQREAQLLRMLTTERVSETGLSHRQFVAGVMEQLDQPVARIGWLRPALRWSMAAGVILAGMIVVVTMNKPQPEPSRLAMTSTGQHPASALLGQISRSSNPAAPLREVLSQDTAVTALQDLAALLSEVAGTGDEPG
jgi:predicted anti-sigma-YlaC factor YlaD